MVIYVALFPYFPQVNEIPPLPLWHIVRILNLTSSAMISLICCWCSQQRALNWMSVLSCCWNLIHMLMSWIPMDFSLLCHRYYPPTLCHPLLFLTVFVSLVHSWLSLLLRIPTSFTVTTHSLIVIVRCDTFTAGEDMNLCCHQAVSRFWVTGMHDLAPLKCFLQINRTR